MLWCSLDVRFAFGHQHTPLELQIDGQVARLKFCEVEANESNRDGVTSHLHFQLPGHRPGGQTSAQLSPIVANHDESLTCQIWDRCLCDHPLTLSNPSACMSLDTKAPLRPASQTQRNFSTVSNARKRRRSR